MNMEEVGDLKPTKKSQPQKRALTEELGDDEEAEKLEKKEESSSTPRKRINTGEIIEGKRLKKTVQRLDSSVAKPKERVKIEQGRGDKLGDIIRVAYFIGKMKVEDLKPLHKVIFDRPGAASTVKKNIRQFSGFPFEADSQPYLKKKERMKKFTNAVLKNMCYVLDLERSGTHDAKIERIITFLLDPKTSGRTLPKKKRKTKDSKRKAQRSNRKNVQEDSKSRAIVTDSSTDDEDDNEQDSQGDANVTEKSAPEPKSRETISDDEDDSSDDVVDKDTDEEVKQPKVVKKPAPKKKPARAKPAPVKPAPKTKKADSSSGRRKKANNTSAGSDLDDSSDDEPLAKMVRKPLTDEQLKETVKKLLKGANLEEVTMKQICKQVFDTYPDHDLSSRKDYIKQTVKQLIS
ncbi:protein DEK [Anguilla anguilla]|uniref:Protein DEK n=1 Tax=Anguilla anguilla TaxID=7936 RepID=A0A9D3MY49_ANGAN|nr:protein DEK [Anguilla anguilla]XP_035268803.1 protein DEK [Anguilla anguilla]XP_035268811.1 protein DEK [Anguilla anguilla]XP_035268822.1 protein DEK [Anguilla anguilla]KAG5857049.1 hypothetical protein ANANG_G00014440 [Anguilla anguilla]